MYKQVRFSIIFLFFIAISFISCDSRNSTQASSTDSISSPLLTTADVALTPKLIGSPLDTLWVEASTFSNLPKKNLAFRFYINNDEKLVMDGWSVKNKNDYPLNPTLKLSVGRQSSTLYNAGDYLGNLLLTDIEIKNIKIKITANT